MNVLPVALDGAVARVGAAEIALPGGAKISSGRAAISDFWAARFLRVDGGMVASDWTMQFLADILDAPVDRPTNLETTALGAAWLAGSRAGVWPDAQGFAKSWARDRRFEPEIDDALRTRKLEGWADAVRRSLSDYRG